MSDTQEPKIPKNKALKKVYGKRPRAFAVKVASGLAPVEAARQAGYKDGKWLALRADHLMQREDVMRAIQEITLQNIPRLVQKGMDIVEESMDNGNRKERMDAAREAFKIGSVYAPTKRVTKNVVENVREKLKLPTDE